MPERSCMLDRKVDMSLFPWRLVEDRNGQVG